MRNHTFPITPHHYTYGESRVLGGSLPAKGLVTVLVLVQCWFFVAQCGQGVV